MYLSPTHFWFLFFVIIIVFLAIVKSSKNVKRRVLWIKRNSSKLKKRWLSYQYFKGDIHYLSKIKYNNKLGLLNFNRKKKSKFLIKKIYSWKFLKIRNLHYKSTVISVPFLFL